jgi:flagellar biosynthesis/type III secretory pathway protein FliH
LVLEINEDEVERARADSRLKWQMDQADRERESYAEGLEKGLAEGRKEAEAAYQVIKREVEELRQKLRDAGIDA